VKPKIKPMGIGDLMVVKQDLVRYAAGEVAHIENVMASESRGREHRRLRRTEDTFVVEEEHVEESQRDLQSTERFELKHEVQKTIVQETKFQIGAEIAGTFGPVQIGVNTDFSTSKSKTESDRRATEFAQEKTEKALSKIVDKVRTERTTKTIEEFEEKNFHKFENADGDNKTGVYRWVDKFYRVKVVNYGRRLFYEFMVPEPAAFFIFARTHNINTKMLPVEPEPPLRPNSEVPLEPSHITPENYLGLTSAYDAAGVTPPPREFVRLTRIITRELQPDQTFAFVDNELEIPEGYVRVGTWVNTNTTRLDEYYYAVSHPRSWVIHSHDDSDSHYSTTTVNGNYPIGVRGHGVRSLMVTVTITCERTGEALAEWKLKTYQAIMDAYQKKQLAYEEQLAAAKIQGGVQIGGNNPIINRSVERDELKKACITLWTGYQYQENGGISHSLPDEGEQVGPAHYPKIDPAKAAALRPEIKFLEQSFDWKNMAYEFYPYYWGRRSQWLQAYGLADPDPLFHEFLKAGMARVLVPVHPAFTAQVLYFQLTGVLWPGADVPWLEPPDPQGDIELGGGDDQIETELELYKEYMIELVHELNGDDIDKEIDISPDDPDAWMVKVPTTLVWLQPDATLPEFD